MIKAIDTLYANHLFRSRLEARWAVYFDELNTKWEYEKEGFELGNGLRYLPDFYLPDYQIYAEIKPDSYTFQEHSKCKRLANLTHKTVVELVGLPHVNMSKVVVPYIYYQCPVCGRKENFLLTEDIHHCDCNRKVKSINAVRELDAILLLHHYKDNYKPLYYSYCDYTCDEVIKNAIKKATSARFEFNYQN